MNLFKNHAKSIAKKTPVENVQVSQPAHQIGIDELLKQDLAKIKQTERDKRQFVKRQLINKYQETFNEACGEDDWSGNDFIFYNILWRFDINDFVNGFELAKIGFEKGLTSPFKSTFATTIADIIFLWAREKYQNNQTTEPYLNEFIVLLENGLDINPIPKAKLLKLYGDVILDNRPEDALSYFQQAETLDEKIGVKNRIKKITTKLNEQPPANK